MRTLAKRLSVSAAALGLIAGGAVVTAAPAAAMYQDCYSYEVSNGNYAVGSCWGRGAEWRMKVACKWERDSYTNWEWLKRERVTVTRQCTFGATDSWIEFRNVN